mmetsp:Transcript_11819/g.13420  ORF Transcript_11819/g.13420 Transcript_11819/m.13420 type:complete len:111 (-) Transcript_11819:126-458(-)
MFSRLIAKRILFRPTILCRLQTFRFCTKKDIEDFTHPLRQANYVCNPRPADLDGFRKQTLYRCRHLGMKELEIIIGDWVEMNLDKMDYKDLDQFEEEVIQVENPVLFSYL